MRKCALIILSVPVSRTGPGLTAARYFVKQVSLVCHVSVSVWQTTRRMWWSGLLCKSARLQGRGIVLFHLPIHYHNCLLPAYYKKILPAKNKK
jgi:hypothetical protein